MSFGHFDVDSRLLVTELGPTDSLYSPFCLYLLAFLSPSLASLPLGPRRLFYSVTLFLLAQPPPPFTSARFHRKYAEADPHSATMATLN